MLWDGGVRLQQHRFDQIQYAIRNIEQKQLLNSIEDEIQTAWRKRDLLLSQIQKSQLDQESASFNLKSLQQGHEDQVVRNWDLRQAQFLLSQSTYLHQQLEADLYFQTFKILMLCYEDAFAH